MEYTGLGTVAERTVSVGICKQCDLLCDPRCLYRICHLPALLPLLCLICPDASALVTGDVVLQRHLTGEHFCASSQPCPSQCVAGCHVSWFVFTAAEPLLPSGLGWHHNLHCGFVLHINKRPPWDCPWGGLVQPKPAKVGHWVCLSHRAFLSYCKWPLTTSRRVAWLLGRPWREIRQFPGHAVNCRRNT